MKNKFPNVTTCTYRVEWAGLENTIDVPSSPHSVSRNHRPRLQKPFKPLAAAGTKRSRQSLAVQPCLKTLRTNSAGKARLVPRMLSIPVLNHTTP